jgi:hypothetical protein
MKNKQIISPVGLKGKEIHERQLALMGINLITENENKGNHAVELTKVGPDGNAYAIVRENHEYYIKRTNKTTGLMLEDFKYIGGLQNKKDEAYPSYAKAIKHLNLKFKSLAEAYNRGGDINVFEDDNLLENHATEHIVDKAGTPLSNKSKEGKEKGQFGDNVADKDVDDEFEKVKVNESGMHGFSEMRGNGFTGEGNLHGNRPMAEYDEPAMQNFIDQYGEEKGKQIYYATANKQGRNPETFEKNEGMTSFGDDVELNEYEQAIEEMMARMESEDDYVDYTMGREDDPNQLPNPPRELNIGEKFPDLTGDGKVTRADILKGRGVDLDEELHGGQHKLDVDKDGDIEADDLADLRAMEESIKKLNALLEGELKKKV